MNLITNMYKKFFKINIISSIKGRVRLNVPYINSICKQWNISEKEIVSIISLIEGINKIEFNSITENILILYDYSLIKESELIIYIKKLVDIIIFNEKQILSAKSHSFDKALEIIRRDFNELFKKEKASS